MINEPKIVEITEVIEETPTIKTFKFDWDYETLGKPNPGEFLMVWNFKNEKPMSIAQINDDELAITVKNIGIKLIPNPNDNSNGIISNICKTKDAPYCKSGIKASVIVAINKAFEIFVFLEVIFLIFAKSFFLFLQYIGKLSNDNSLKSLLSGFNI